jgi:hypothetical protein
VLPYNQSHVRDEGLLRFCLNWVHKYEVCDAVKTVIEELMPRKMLSKLIKMRCCTELARLRNASATKSRATVVNTEHGG